MVHRWVPVALLVAALAAPLPFAGAGPSAASTTHVHIENFAYNPQSVSINLGDTVQWDNHDSFAHTVTADDGSFNSGNLFNGGTYSRAFNAVGSVTYHCQLHPSMTGTIHVSDPNALSDLVVSGITFSDAVPGVTKRIDVTVRNLGDASAPASTLAVSYAHQGQTHAIGTAAVPLLGPNNSATVRVEWGTALKVGDFQVLAEADSGGVVTEADEGNNVGVATASVLVGNVPGIDLADPL